jgi:hypothetical protein
MPLVCLSASPVLLPPPPDEAAMGPEGELATYPPSPIKTPE